MLYWSWHMGLTYSGSEDAPNEELVAMDTFMWEVSLLET